MRAVGFFDRFRHRHPEQPDPVPPPHVEAPPQRTVVEIDASSLSRVFSAPVWLRDLGLLAWFLVGVALVLVGATWLLSITATIVEPVIAGTVIAAVASPLVSRMQAHRLPRAAGAAIVLLGLVALGVVIFALVVGGITEQAQEIKAASSQALDKITGWLNDVGANNTKGLERDTAQGVSTAGATLIQGLAKGINGLTSLIFFITFTIFTLFFVLKDGPTFRGFVNRNMGVPPAVASTITGNVVSSLRRYFLGVTFVAAFNGIVVGLGALVLGVPLAGTIAVVTFVTAYVPFIGAFVAGAFAVVLALASQGTTVALIMLVIVILANGALQNIVQPIAFGATLELNPLVVLIATIGAGSLFGMVGLILGAPLTSAALHISKDLAAAKARAAAESGQDPGPAPLGADVATDLL
jgi:predicted PurR-regulated permease PerM